MLATKIVSRGQGRRSMTMVLLSKHAASLAAHRMRGRRLVSHSHAYEAGPRHTPTQAPLPCKAIQASPPT